MQAVSCDISFGRLLGSIKVTTDDESNASRIEEVGEKNDIVQQSCLCTTDCLSFVDKSQTF